MSSRSYSAILQTSLGGAPVPTDVQIIGDDDELIRILRSCSTATPKRETTRGVRTDLEEAFMDAFSGRLFDTYSGLRDILRDHAVPHETDHSRFIDVVMRNVCLREMETVSEEDGTADHELSVLN